MLCRHCTGLLAKCKYQTWTDMFAYHNLKMCSAWCQTCHVIHVSMSYKCKTSKKITRLLSKLSKQVNFPKEPEKVWHYFGLLKEKKVWNIKGKCRCMQNIIPSCSFNSLSPRSVFIWQKQWCLQGGGREELYDRGEPHLHTYWTHRNASSEPLFWTVNESFTTTGNFHRAQRFILSVTLWHLSSCWDGPAQIHKPLLQLWASRGREG